MWVWLQDSDQEGVVQSQSPIWQDKDDDSPGECTQMALGTLGRWRKAQCAGQYHFICEMEVNGEIFVSLKDTRNTHECESRKEN